MSDNEKPKLGLSVPLGVRRTVETGKVKQSFSHGRSNTVIVETKKARILRKPCDPAPAAEPEVQEAAPPPRRFPPVPSPKRPEPAARPARGRQGADRRQSGKLTVTRALDDGDGGARARSLAALKRAREKDKRAHQAGGPAAKQVREVI